MVGIDANQLTHVRGSLLLRRFNHRLIFTIVRRLDVTVEKYVGPAESLAEEDLREYFLCAVVIGTRNGESSCLLYTSPSPRD